MSDNTDRLEKAIADIFGKELAKQKKLAEVLTEEEKRQSSLFGSSSLFNVEQFDPYELFTIPDEQEQVFLLGNSTPGVQMNKKEFRNALNEAKKKTLGPVQNIHKFQWSTEVQRMEY